MNPDGDQLSVIDAPPDVSGVVIGAPGTGKTATLVARVQRLIASGELGPEEILVLTSTRRSATVLRDRLAFAVARATPGPLARSLASFAYQIVRAAAVQAGEGAPQLLTGAEQDGIIADLLEGDAEDERAGSVRWPAHLTAEVRGSRVFRTELRTLMAECTERGVSPEDLAALGRAAERDDWRAAASFIAEYRDTVSALHTGHRDAAQLMREAAALVSAAPHGEAAGAVLGAPAWLRTVLVDDAQELTRGALTLLRALRARGVAVLAFGDPDIGSGVFRGVDPRMFGELIDALGTMSVLTHPHRTGETGGVALLDTVRRITASIGASGPVAHRIAPRLEPRETDAADDARAGVRTFIEPSPHDEYDRIARVLREWHIMQEWPWNALAVIAHDTRQVASLEAELAAREVPVRAAGTQRPLGSEPAVRDILRIVALGLDEPAVRDPDELTDALLSPFGGLDAVGLRRLRARLRHAEFAAGGSEPTRVLLARALSDPVGLALLGDAPEERAAQRLAETIARVHADHAAGADIHSLLWTVWEGARDASGRPLARVWRDASRERGAGATPADQALDALVALFDSAKRFVERSPHERPVVFLRRILDSAVPEDTLGSTGRPHAVTVMTPAAALGEEFDGVVLAGLQEGVWPNLRARGGMLGAPLLDDAVVAWREGREPRADIDLLDQRRTVLHDELRLLVRAVSRARRAVAITAVSDDDLAPGPFFALLPEPDRAPTEGRDADPSGAHPLTLRGLVARHRRTLTTETDPGVRAHAAAQLAVLAREGVPGAAPEEWYGVTAPTSTAPLIDTRREAVSVSPSAMQTLEDCAVNWAVRALGGDSRSSSAGVGSILHEALERVPSGDIDEVRAVIDERWGDLDFEAPWMSHRERAWAETLAVRLSAYLAEFGERRGELLGAEVRFRLAVRLDDGGGPPVVRVLADDEQAPTAGHVIVSGSIDRVERLPATGVRDELIDPDRPDADRVLVVDLKTGRGEMRVSDDKVSDDPQLAAYQLAIREGAIPSARPEDLAGAALVILSKTLVSAPNYRRATQPPLDGAAQEAFLARVAEAADRMAASSFAAPVDEHCRTARFALCTLHTIKAVSAS